MKTIAVRINSCELFPDGLFFEVPKYLFRGNNTLFFQEQFQFLMNDENVTIPAGILLVFDQPAVDLPGENQVLRVVTETWSLHTGIHQGTIASRDSQLIPGYESLEAVKESYAKEKISNQRFGYDCWFAHAIPPGQTPNGKWVEIDKSVPYLR